MSIIDKMKNNKIIKNSILSEDVEINFISTGCLTLNLLFSGKLLPGGIPIGKISQISADSAMGKSFLGLKIIANAQKLGMESIMIDSEFAFNFDFAEANGVDKDKLLVIQDNSIESVQQKLLTILEDVSAEDRKKLLIVLDSWGGLVTSKTVDDATAGADKVDMTISKKKNTLARILTGLGCTVFVITQVYSTMDQYNPITPAGGKGIYYASSCIVMCTSKARDKDSDDIVGAVITAKTLKGRFAVEHSKLKFVIKHESGIHPTLGLEDDLLEFGYMFKPANGWYSRDFEKLGLEGEDRKWRMKEIQDNWQEFYKPILTNKDVLLDFEKKYSFKHNEMIKVDYMLDDVL